MAKIVEIAEEHLWDSICGESDEPFPICSKDDVLHEDYDPALHHPVFCGYLCAKVDTYEDAAADFDPATSHPACVGYVLIDIPKKHVKPKCDEAPDPKTCEPSEYLQYYIFPLLVPALTEVLRQAKLENCFVRKKTKFNCADFLTEYLYKNNPNYNDRQDITLWDIPFVKEWLKDQYAVSLKFKNYDDGSGTGKKRTEEYGYKLMNFGTRKCLTIILEQKVKKIFHPPVFNNFEETYDRNE
uniref:Uncharacterized protein n=1 Tax=Octopus bimaculoides TaxID=37653 RepID=A0A0L8FN80_OCTBM